MVRARPAWTSRGKHVLILGGYGLVGQAVARRLIREKPRRITLLSLKREEAEEARDAPSRPRREASSSWPPGATSSPSPTSRTVRAARSSTTPRCAPRIIESLLDPLTEAAAAAVLPLPAHHRGAARHHRGRREHRHRHRLPGHLQDEPPGLPAPCRPGPTCARAWRCCSSPTTCPSSSATSRCSTSRWSRRAPRVYVKIGTSGTGGMGLNIPYTHSEEKPSRVLLSKSALAGAHTLLLFLMARTPGGPITKEIKPAAAIAWKRIGFGPRSCAGGRPGAPRTTSTWTRPRPCVPGARFRLGRPARGAAPRASTSRTSSSTPARTASSPSRSSPPSPPASRWSS